MGRDYKAVLHGLLEKFKNFAAIVGQRFFNRLQNSKAFEVPPSSQWQDSLRKAKHPALFLLGFFIAHLLWLTLSTYFIKPPANLIPPPPKVVIQKPLIKSRAQYESIVSKNAFCPGCPVPDLKLIAAQRPKDCYKAKPISNSNLKVTGNVVLSRPEFSVVLLQEGSAESKALMVGENVTGVGKIFDIKQDRICFESNDGRLLFLKTPQDPFTTFGQPRAGLANTSSGDGGIQRSSETEAEIRRDFLMEKLEDPSLLYQASAIPYIGEDGKPKGFKITGITPGSVYEQLGFKPDDILTNVNGDALDSLAKAQSMFSSIRTVKEVEMTVIRGGSPTVLKFKVR